MYATYTCIPIVLGTLLRYLGAKMEKVMTKLHRRANAGHTEFENSVFIWQMPYCFLAFPGRDPVVWDLTLTSVTSKIP